MSKYQYLNKSIIINLKFSSHLELLIISGIIPDTGIDAIPALALLLLLWENAIPLIFFNVSKFGSCFLFAIIAFINSSNVSSPSAIAQTSIFLSFKISWYDAVGYGPPAMIGIFIPLFLK